MLNIIIITILLIGLVLQALVLSRITSNIEKIVCRLDADDDALRRNIERQAAADFEAHPNLKPKGKTR